MCAIYVCVSNHVGMVRMLFSWSCAVYAVCTCVSRCFRLAANGVRLTCVTLSAGGIRVDEDIGMA